MNGFTKLFSSITESSVWVESDKTLRIWVAFLARADAEGFVEGSIPGMANLCMMSIDDFMAAIKPLLGPDHFSRNPENEGRRLKESPGGWLILNYRYYREKPQDKQGSAAERMRRYRARKKGVTDDVTLQENVTRYTEAEEEAEKKYMRPPQESAFWLFYKPYPKKKNRLGAIKAWTKLNPSTELIQTLLTALERQKKTEDWQKEGGKYIPYPATWLNARRWEDEIPEEPKSRWGT
jgi:hypothetical protein